MINNTSVFNLANVGAGNAKFASVADGLSNTLFVAERLHVCKQPGTNGSTLPQPAVGASGNVGSSTYAWIKSWANQPTGRESFPVFGWIDVNRAASVNSPSDIYPVMQPATASGQCDPNRLAAMPGNSIQFLFGDGRFARFRRASIKSPGVQR